MNKPAAILLKPEEPFMESSKESVLQAWPDAQPLQRKLGGEWAIVRIGGNGNLVVLGTGGTEDEAWDDADSRPAAKQPASPADPPQAAEPKLGDHIEVRPISWQEAHAKLQQMITENITEEIMDIHQSALYLQISEDTAPPATPKPASTCQSHEDIKEAAFEMFIAERKKVVEEWGLSDSYISSRTLVGVDAEVNERIRVRYFSALRGIAEPASEPGA